MWDALVNYEEAFARGVYADPILLDGVHLRGRAGSDFTLDALRDHGREDDVENDFRQRKQDQDHGQSHKEHGCAGSRLQEEEYGK